MHKSKGYKKSRKKERNTFQSVLIGAGLSAAVLLLLTLISSAVLMLTDYPLAAAETVSLVALLLSAALSGYMISHRAHDNKMLISSLSSLLFCLVLLLCGLIGSCGDVSGKVLLNYLCYMGIGLLFARIGGIERKRRRSFK